MAKQEYPKWMYGPEGKSRIFNKDDVVPKGWADHPNKVKQPKSKDETKQEVKEVVPEPTPEERAETIRSVREAAVAQGIEINLSDDASVEEINAAIDKLTGSN